MRSVSSVKLKFSVVFFCEDCQIHPRYCQLQNVEHKCVSLLTSFQSHLFFLGWSEEHNKFWVNSASSRLRDSAEGSSGKKPFETELHEASTSLSLFSKSWFSSWRLQAELAGTFTLLLRSVCRRPSSHLTPQYFVILCEILCETLCEILCAAALPHTWPHNTL